MFALQRAHSYYQCLTDGINRQTASTHHFITHAHIFRTSVAKNASMNKERSCEAGLGKGRGGGGYQAERQAVTLRKLTREALGYNIGQDAGYTD
jgi:hypothetical protein